MAPLSLKIILEEGAVCRTILFSTTTTVREAHEIVLEKFHNSLNQEKAYGLFLTSADDENSGIWLESHRTLDYYMLRDGDSLQYLCKTRNLRVRMLDGSVKTLQVDESKVVGELLLYICSKIGITNYDEYGFCREEHAETEEPKAGSGTLTLKRKIQKDKDVKLEQLSKKLRTDDNVEWLSQVGTLRELKVDPTETLLLKRRLFYSDRKIDARDPVQLNLLYVQTRDDILNGRQVTTEDKAVEFAGIQCQVHFGDFDEEKHKPGFIENLAEYLPKPYVSSWGIEKKIYREYRKHLGVNQLDAKYLYTKIAREHPTYGVTFFLVKEQEKGKKKMVPRLLGINANSILRLDEKTKEILKVWLLTQVKSYHAGKSTFTLNFGDYSDKEYAVKTNEAYRIRDILEGYIDIIRRKLEGPSNVTYEEGQIICEDNVEKFKGTVIQTVVPHKLVEHSYVGPNQIISQEIGHEIREGTQIVTVQQILVTKKGDMKQQAASGMAGCMPVDFHRRINHLNSQSVKAVMLLGDPSRGNLDLVRKIADNFEDELPGLVQGVEELAKLQTSEEDKNKLLDDLQQIRKYMLEFISTMKSSDCGASANIETAEEAAKKIAELSSLVVLSSDPKIRRRSELLRRSRKSFIADERVEATLRRASFLVVVSSASKAVEQAVEELDTPYRGPPVSKDDAVKFKSSAADKLAKLNAAIALLLAARADPQNVDYETAVNSMTTINDLTPLLIEDAKALSSTIDGEEQIDLLRHINGLCQSLNTLCNLNVSNEGSEIQDAANNYAKSAGKLIYVFNPKGLGGKSDKTSDPDKTNEIIDLAKKIRNDTNDILSMTSDLTKSTSNDPRARTLDNVSVKCAEAAQGLVACSEITAPTIHEPHCQSALTAAVENFSSSAQQLTSAWKPLVEEQQYQQYGQQLDEKTSKLIKTLERLKKAYGTLDGDDKAESRPKPVPKPKDIQRLQFITSLSAAKHSIKEIERELQEIKKDLEGKPVKNADINKERLRQLLSQKLSQLNAAMGSLVLASCDRECPDYETAAAATNTINELNPEIIKGIKDLCPYENEKTRKEMLEDIAALWKATRNICGGAERSNPQDVYDAASNFADSSGKLCYIFNPRSNPEKENQILDLSRSACEKASEMLSKVYQLTESVGGEDGSKLDSSGTRVVNAAQSLLTVTQITAPSIGDERCCSTLITSADLVSNLTQDLASLWEPILRNPEYHPLGELLNKDRESLEALLEKLKKACRMDIDTAEETNDQNTEEKLKLSFIAAKTTAKKNLEEAEKLLQDSNDVAVLSQKLSKDTPVYKDLQRLTAQQLAELNAAVAALMRATSDTSNMKYETAESAVATISLLTPDIIQNTNKLCQYADEKQRIAMLDNVRALCKANKLICESMDKNDIQELNKAANKFSNSSGKLCYTFNPRANSMKENQLLDLSREACENTSLMLSRVYELAEAVGGEEGSRLDISGAKVVDAAQALLTTAQITAVSISDPRCQSELIMSADTVSNLTQELASVWKPLIQSPNHEALGKQINMDQKNLEKVLEKLKKACRLDKDKTENINDLNEKKRVKFINTAAGARKKLSDVEKFLQDNSEIIMHTSKLNKDTPEYKELQRLSAHKLAELNAAIAALMQATSDSLNPDYTAADSAVSTISQVMPEIVQNTSKLCEYEDENQRHAMLERIRALCAANQLVCGSLEKNDVKGLMNAADKFAQSSGKLYYVFNPHAVQLVENQIVDLSKAALTKISDMSSSVKKLSDNIGGEEGHRLEKSGKRLVDAAYNLLATAHITAPSITDSRCQSQLSSSTDVVAKLAGNMSSEWEPLAMTPPLAANQPLGDKLNADRKTLEAILGKLRNASNPNSDLSRLMATISSAKTKLAESEKLLEDSSITPNELNEKSPEYKKLQCILTPKLAELNAAVACLVRATSDTENPDYITLEKELTKISQLTPEIVLNTKKLAEYMKPKQCEELLDNIRSLMKANRLIYDNVETGDSKKLSNAANVFAKSSGKLYYVFNPPHAAHSVKENLLVGLSKAVYEKASIMLSVVEQLVEAAGREDGCKLDSTAARVANTAQELRIVAQITTPSIEDGKCQSVLVASAKNLSSLTEDLSSNWAPIVQNSKHAGYGQELSNHKKELNDMVKKLITECKVKPEISTKPSKPEPPVRNIPVDSNEEKLKSKHVQFCKSINTAQDTIRKAEEDLKRWPDDNNSTRPLIVGAQEKLQNLIVNNLSLAAVAVSQLISDMGPDHVNYDSAIKATKVLTELIPTIVQDSKELSTAQEDTAKQELLSNILSLCEVSTKLCDTAKNNVENLNDVAVEFGNRAAKLVYDVSAEVNPGQEKEVIRRAREIGDSASRLAVRGAEGALEVKDARAHALCAAATRCAHSASDLMYTAKLVAPTIHKQQSLKALLEVSNQLASKAMEFSLSWQPLYSNETHHAFVKDLDNEAELLKSLLENFNQDLKNDKLLKLRVVEKLVVQDTPLRQLASNILENIKAKAESSDSSEDKRKFLDYSNKLAAAIKDLDVANAKSRNAPHDIKRREHLEEAVQHLQQLCLESRIQAGAEKRFVDLMDLINDVSSDAKNLSEETMNVKPEYNKYALITIKSQSDDIVKAAAQASLPPEMSNDGEVIDGTFIIKHFAQDTDERVAVMQVAVEEVRDAPSQTTLRNKLMNLKLSCDLLRLAVNSHIAAVRSATLEANLADFEEMEKNVSSVLQSTRKKKNLNKETDTASAAMATATTLCSAVASKTAAEKIPPALATYLLETRSISDLADPKHKSKLEQHLKKLLDLLKTHTMATSRLNATWQEIDDGEVANITRQVIQEIESFNKEDNVEVQKRNTGEVLDHPDLKKLLLPPAQVVYGDQKQLNNKLHQQLQKLSSLTGAVQHEFSQREPLRTLPKVADAAAELKAVARIIAVSDPLKRAWIEDAADAICFTTYNFLKTAETASKDPHNPDYHRLLNEAWRLLNESINKLGQLKKSEDKMKRDCTEIARNLELQFGLLQTHYPSNMMNYVSCLEPLQNQNNLQSIQIDDPMNREECSASLQYLSSMICHSSELAAQCGYLLALPDEYQHIGKDGFFNVPRILNIAVSLRLACLSILRSKDLNETNYIQSEINKQVIELQDVVEESVEKLRNPEAKRDVLESMQEVDEAAKNLRETLESRPDIKTITSLAPNLLDAVEDFTAVIGRVTVIPRIKHSENRKVRSEQVINNAKTLLTKTQALVSTVSSSDFEVLTWKMFESNRSELLKSYKEFVNCIACGVDLNDYRENGRRAGFIENTVEQAVESSPVINEPKKTFIELQYDLARKWLTKPASKPDEKSAGVQGVNNIIDFAEKMSDDMKGDEKIDMQSMIDETKQLLDDCSKKYNSEKASLLLERLRELQRMLKWRVVTRVVEDFLEEEPLADLEILTEGEADGQQRKFILDKKIADLLAQMGRMTKTARYVADAGSGVSDSELMQTKDQMELLAPALVKAAQHRIECPNNKEAVETYKRFLTQYSESMFKLREICDRSVDPMELAQAAGETIQRIREDSTRKNDPQTSANTSRAITRLGLRVIEAGMCSQEAQSDPELKQALAQAQGRLTASTKLQQRSSRAPDWRDITAEILRTTGEVESFLGGENIFQKQPEPDQPIYAAALDLHAAVREWSARDNEIVAVAKRMAVQMARLSEYMHNERKFELLTTSKDIVTSSRQVAALARKLALECTDMRIRTNLMQVCEQIPTISGQLKMLITVKGSSMGNQGTQESRDAMDTLVSNAQNLMASIQEVVKAAIGASVKIMSQRGPRMKWVRRACYNY